MNIKAATVEQVEEDTGKQVNPVYKEILEKIQKNGPILVEGLQNRMSFSSSIRAVAARKEIPIRVLMSKKDKNAAYVVLKTDNDEEEDDE